MRARAFLLAALLAAPCASAAVGDDPDHGGPVEPFQVAAATQDSIRYVSRVTDNNLVGLTVTNYGFLGNNFINRSPSLEYPLGTGYEHMVRAGLWIGAKALCDTCTVPFLGVSTGTVDGSQGGASASATEFAPAGNNILIRSRLQNSRYFSPLAVSEQDLVCEYSDIGVTKFAGSSELHRSLSVLVKQEVFSWSFADFAHLLIVRFRITNLGEPMESVWVALYGELASGPKFAYSGWPPSQSTGGSLGSWYRKKYLRWDADERMVREHYCEGGPPNDCRFEVTPYWMGFKLLGVKPAIPDTQITLAAWNWEPGSTARDQDVERYAILRSGTIANLDDPILFPPSGDPVELLGVGLVPLLNPLDTVRVDFAIVGGGDEAEIRQHADFAQLAFDNDYVVPTPPPSPTLRVVPRQHALDLYWDDLPDTVSDPTSPQPGGRDFEGYRVYIGEDRNDLRLLAQFDRVDTTGFNTGLDTLKSGGPWGPETFPDDTLVYRYHYTVPALRDGFKYFVALTSFDMGDNQVAPLESGTSQNKSLGVPAPRSAETGGGVVVFPNPYRVEARWDTGRLVRDHYLWFANLPEEARIKIFTLAGDLVYETDFDGRVYQGANARGIYNPAADLDLGDPAKGKARVSLSGATFGWNMISREGQAIATGLYLYSVEDKKTGDRQLGKFLVVKSDREGR